MSEEKYITMDGKEPFIIYNDYWSKMREKDIEIERLNNIIKRLEEDLKEMYLTFGEFSEEYTENRIKELKGDDKSDKS